MTPFRSLPFIAESPTSLAGAILPIESVLIAALDRALDCDRLGASVDLLRNSLAQARRACTHPDQWRSLVERRVRTHPALHLAQLLLEAARLCRRCRHARFHLPRRS